MNICFLLTVLVAVAVASVGALHPQQTLLRRTYMSNTRIVGGYPIDISDAPFQVSFLVYGDHNCGGSIVSNRFILTAAHCTMHGLDQMTVRVGSSKHASGGLVMEIERIYRHELYDPRTLDYDFAVLKLKGDIHFDRDVQPIKLPKNEETLEEGTMLNVTGWGYTLNSNESMDILRLVTVPFISNERCNQDYENYPLNITDRMMCAGFEAGGKDACAGDSGGPLFADGTLYGVVSWGEGCAEPGHPGVYSKVTAVLDWIKGII